MKGFIMFRKAHILFTLLCAGITTAVVILTSLLYLHVSENNLLENQFHSFQNDVSTITASLETSSSISMQWLEKLEAQNDYIIFVIDNGIPFLYNTLRSSFDSRSQSLFTESIEAYDTLFKVSSAGNLRGNFSGVWHTEYQFYSAADKNTYFSSLIDIENNHTLSRIVILFPLTTLHAQFFQQRIHFLWIDLAAAVILFAFSWFFTGRLIKPLQENHDSQIMFLAAASHELRTPLSVILASVECCQSASAEEQKGFFGTVRKEGKRMNSLIDDMLTLALSDTGRFSVEKSDVQLDTLCLNAYEAFESLCVGKKLSLSLALPEEPLPRCGCDAGRIAQMLSILLHNAVSYTPEGGQITLSLRHSSTHSGLLSNTRPFPAFDSYCFEITVSDTGIGIGDEDKKYVFDRFYRAEKSRSVKGHFGLGLSIAHDIVAAHHGRITVSDNPGGGSVFTVRLPE